jgi:hypothetical protein
MSVMNTKNIKTILPNYSAICYIEKYQLSDMGRKVSYI